MRAVNPLAVRRCARGAETVQHNQVWQASSTYFLYQIKNIMNALKTYASALADAFLCGDPDLRSLLARGRRCLGYSPDWLKPLCKEVIQHELTEHPKKLAAFIYNFESLRSYWRRNDIKHSIAYYYFPQPKAKSPAPFVDRSVIRLYSLKDLCGFLELDENQLHWLSDPWGSSSGCSHGPLQHYLYRWIAKKSSDTYRLLEIPKIKLKSVQRKINRELLTNIPAHPDVHGFVSGRSTVSFTHHHIDKQWVLKMDLKHFFTRITYTRIFNIFSTLGYPHNVVRLLSLLCTNRVPRQIIGKRITDWTHRKTLLALHLPQGAPTSPALSNLAAFNLDCRLSALARSIDINYSRYADDILFSGNSRMDLNNFIAFIGYIAAEEGFLVNYRKTRVMGKGQRQTATGIVLNKHHNIPREEYEQLKAVLHNCVTKGVKSQNNGHTDFYAHLKGKLNYFSMLNPAKAKKLERQFLKIDWNS